MLTLFDINDIFIKTRHRLCYNITICGRKTKTETTQVANVQRNYNKQRCRFYTVSVTSFKFLHICTWTPCTAAVITRIIHRVMISCGGGNKTFFVVYIISVIFKKKCVHCRTHEIQTPCSPPLATWCLAIRI